MTEHENSSHHPCTDDSRHRMYPVCSTAAGNAVLSGRDHSYAYRSESRYSHSTESRGTKILITYIGGPDADPLMELDTTVIDSKGKAKTQSMGSRLSTTPQQRGGTDIFQGPYTEKVHVLIIGHFANVTHQDVLDTWI